MSYASDDLTPMFGQSPGPALGYRQGIIVFWDPVTAENTVLVGGASVDNLPILNTNEALLLTPGSVVALLTFGHSWFILGRVTIPGTPEAASALRMVATAADTVATYGTTTSTSWTDLATVGPQVTVTVGASGRLLVMVTCAFDYNGADSQGGGYMSFDLAGPTPEAASEFTAVKSVFSVSDTSADVATWIVGARQTATSLREGLAPGTYTVTAKYKTHTGDEVGFFDRDLVVIPL
ncbi:hypothetical protein AB0I37_24870 [Micromonospora purpureochromogenes]|uniref:hypothetical protein n=1 Tax=Micromonospora purpureochromogenes TaxID=47872 RepID=UPI0034007F36